MENSHKSLRYFITQRPIIQDILGNVMGDHVVQQQIKPVMFHNHHQNRQYSQTTTPKHPSFSNTHPGATCLLLNPRHRDLRYLPYTDNPSLATSNQLCRSILNTTRKVLRNIIHPIQILSNSFTASSFAITINTIRKLCRGNFCNVQT